MQGTLFTAVSCAFSYALRTDDGQFYLYNNGPRRARSRTKEAMTFDETLAARRTSPRGSSGDRYLQSLFVVFFSSQTLSRSQLS